MSYLVLFSSWLSLLLKLSIGFFSYCIFTFRLSVWCFWWSLLLCQFSHFIHAFFPNFMSCLSVSSYNSLNFFHRIFSEFFVWQFMDFHILRSVISFFSFLWWCHIYLFFFLCVCDLWIHILASAHLGNQVYLPNYKFALTELDLHQPAQFEFWGVSAGIVI